MDGWMDGWRDVIWVGGWVEPSFGGGKAILRIAYNNKKTS
jgi:hypothetical protein